MKTKVITAVTATALAWGMLTASATADVYTWTNGTSTGVWSTASNWQGSNVAVGADNTADFSTLDITANRTVTLTGATTIGNLAFGDIGADYFWWLLSGSTLTLVTTTGTAPVINVLQNSSAYIGTVIAGTNGLAKTGAGTLVLNSANKYTGDTTVEAGTLRLNATSAASPNSHIYVKNGGTLDAYSTNSLGSSSIPAITVYAGGLLNKSYSTATLIHLGSLELQGGTLAATGTANATLGHYFLDGDVTVSGGGTSTITATKMQLTKSGGVTFNVASGSVLNVGGATGTASFGTLSSYTTYDLIKAGQGTMILGGSSNYATNTCVNAGVLAICHSNALGSVAGSTTVASGAALQIYGNIAVPAEALSLSGTGISNDGSLRNTSGTNSYAGLITLGGDCLVYCDAGSLALNNTGTITGSGFTLTIGGDGNTTIAGCIGTGTGGLVKNGLGTLTLSGASTYAGDTIINAGKIAITSEIASSSLIDVGQNGVFDVSAHTTSAFEIASGQTLAGKGLVTGGSNSTAVVIASGATLSPGESGVGTLTFDSALTLAGTTAMDISKSGATYTSDLITGATTLALGGKLSITATGDALAIGDSLTLFSATGISGEFSSYDLPTLASGLAWDTSSLGSGVLSVTTIPEPCAMIILLSGMLGMIVCAWRPEK